MEQVRARVAAKKEQGLYSLDGLASRGGVDVEPFNVQDLIWLDEVAEIRPDLDLVQSTKPGVGAVVGKAKGKLARATSQPLLDLAVLLVADVAGPYLESPALRSLIEHRGLPRESTEG